MSFSLMKMKFFLLFSLMALNSTSPTLVVLNSLLTSSSILSMLDLYFSTLEQKESEKVLPQSGNIISTLMVYGHSKHRS